MNKKLLSLILASMFAATGAQAECSDADLKPEVLGSISTNAPLGSLLAALPCGTPTPTTYTDAIGREFSVYTWATPNKSLTVQVFEGRVFTTSGSNLAYRSKTVAAPDAAFDTATKVMSLPVLTVTDKGGTPTTYYDAKVALGENGTWSILSMDSEQRGDQLYDTRGYTPASYDVRTGAFTAPNVTDSSGQKFNFSATLGSNGYWSDTASGAGPIAGSSTITPAQASFDATTSVVTLPVLTITTAEGSTSTVYDAKIQLNSDGQWTVLSSETAPPDGKTYDLRATTIASLDWKTGTLSVPELKDPSGNTISFKAALAPDGTWADTSIGTNQGIVPSLAASTPELASFDSTSSVMRLPVLTITQEDGSTRTVYDAQISLDSAGNWSVLTTSDKPPVGVRYDLSNYTLANLNQQNGALTVPKLMAGESLVSFKATLDPNGSWTDNSAVTGSVPLSLTNVAVATGAYSNGTTKWPGLAQGGIVVIGTTAYRASSACSIPSAMDSVRQVGGVDVQTIEDNPNLTVYRSGSNLYLDVAGADTTCSVESLGTI